MKKVVYLLIMFIVLGLCSCNKKTTVVNNVINQTVDIEDSITIESLEDVICNTISNVELPNAFLSFLPVNSFILFLKPLTIFFL